MIKIKERRHQLVTRTVTVKSEDRSIKDDDYVSPAGHLTFVKNRTTNGEEVSAQLLSVGGARMEDGRTWSTASTLMSRTILISRESLELGELTHLRSFQLTSSHNNRTTKGSVVPCLTNAAGVDLESPVFDTLNIIIYGGQYTDKIVTSDDVVTITGTLTEDIKDSKLDVTVYTAKNEQYKEFNIPQGWSDGSEFVQEGEVSSRTGHSLSKLRTENGHHLLLCSGGHSKPSILQPFFHPDDSLNILQIPGMKWTKLIGNVAFKRSFHAQAVNSQGEVIILGGKSMIDGRWSKIHPLTEVLILKIEDDFSYSGRELKLNSDIQELSLLTNFSFTSQDDKMFFFSGFKFPKYKDNNLHKFLPPNTSKDRLPEFGTHLYVIDMNTMNVSSLEGPEDSGSYNGTIAWLNHGEMVLTSDPSMYLYSERVIESPKCELDVKFGACTLALAEKSRESYICSTPSCKKRIHAKCDKSIRGKFKATDKKLCPTCNNLDPVTWKKIKQIRLRTRE